MHDIDIRKELRDNYLFDFVCDKDAVVLDELPVCNGKSIIDLAVVNGCIHGYEIKSAHDTLARLPSQIKHYGKVLDFVTIITSESHLKEVRKRVPRWWGISLMEKEGSIIYQRQIRKKKRNPKTDKFSLAQFFWKDDAVRVLEDQGIKGIKSKRRWLLWEMIAKELSHDHLSSLVRETLKIRHTESVVSL